MNSSYYSSDGRGNNIQHPEWGSAATPRIRSAPNLTSYVDGIFQPKTEEQGLPSAQRILLELCQRVDPKPNKKMSQLLLYFGQFISHDISRSLESSNLEKDSMPIPCGFARNFQNNDLAPVPPHPIPRGAVGTCNSAALASTFGLSPLSSLKECEEKVDFDEQLFDPFVRVQKNSHREEENDGSLSSSPFHAATTSINFVTSFLDLSHVYGPHVGGPDQINLRAFEGGEMILDPLDGLPPKDPKTGYFIMADPESRKTPPMAALVTVFLRYHNIRANHHAKNSAASLSDDELYWRARQDTTVAYQNIVEEKYLPTLLDELLEPYEKYNPAIDPRIDVFFSVSSFRYGHSGLSGVHRLLDNEFHPLSADPWFLRDVYTRTETVLLSDEIAGSVLRGLTAEPSKANDISFVDDVAFFTGVMALTNIQRGRDEGLPSHNDAREWFGLDRLKSFKEISYGDALIEEALAGLYNSVDDIDAYIGDLLDPNTEVMFFSIKDQFTRLRDGDRFWYKAILSESEIATLPSLTEIIKLTFGEAEMVNLPVDSFAVKDLTSTSGVGNKPVDGTNILSLIEDKLVATWSFTQHSRQTQGSSRSIDMKLEVNDLVSGGFIGIGWGSQLMRDAEMWFCQASELVDHHLSCSDSIDLEKESNEPEFTCCIAETKSRIAPKCFDEQRFDLTIVDSCISANQTFVTLQAPICESANSDESNCFDLINGEIDYIAAYNPSTIGSHGFSRRTMGRVDLSSGFGTTASSSSSNGGLFAVHGGMMMLCWLVLVPVAIFIVRYCKQRSWRIGAHMALVGVSCSVVFSLAPAAIVSVEGTLFGTVDGGSGFTDHKIVGLCVIALAMFMLITGEVRLTREANFLVNSPKIDRMIFLLHRCGGLALIIFAWYNCYTGLVRMEAYEEDLIEITWFSTFVSSSGVGFFTLFRVNVFFPWIAFICLVFIMTEYYQRCAVIKIQKNEEENVGNGIFDEMADLEGKDMSIETFLDLTRQGSPLCIVDGYVIDVGDFMTYHPGGSRVFRGVVGADITQQILGKRDVDGISHAHSPMAFLKLRKLAKARLANSISYREKDNDSDLENSSSNLNQPDCSLLVFREGKIIDYTYVTVAKNIKSKPVLRILLSLKRDALDELSPDSFTPFPSTTFVFRGKDSFGSTVERPYTPVRYFVNSTFEADNINKLELERLKKEEHLKEGEVVYEFFISLNSNGMMSRHIHQMQKGDHIMVQGPMANLPVVKKIRTNELMWCDLICIASGTGISPILQLIDYHCGERNGRLSNKKQKVFLVWFLQFTHDMSSSFKGAVKLDARRQKYGDNFRYIILYSKNKNNQTIHESPNQALHEMNNAGLPSFDTGEDKFRQAVLISKRLRKHRIFQLFHQKQSSISNIPSTLASLPVDQSTDLYDSINHSINHLNAKDKDKFHDVQTLYDQKRHVDKDLLLKLFSGIIDEWNETDSTNLELELELEEEVEQIREQIRSISTNTKVAICGSPMFDDECMEFCKEFDFEDDQLLFFGPGDSCLNAITMPMLNERRNDGEKKNKRSL